LNTKIYDEVVRITSEDAADMARKLARSEGILVGISSGAAVAAARTLALREGNTGKTFIVILPDCGERYLSTWLWEDE
jgi:cysteine synthase A